MPQHKMGIDVNCRYGAALVPINKNIYIEFEFNCPTCGDHNHYDMLDPEFLKNKHAALKCKNCKEDIKLNNGKPYVLGIESDIIEKAS